MRQQKNLFLIHTHICYLPADASVAMEQSTRESWDALSDFKGLHFRGFSALADAIRGNLVSRLWSSPQHIAALSFTRRCLVCFDLSPASTRPIAEVESASLLKQFSGSAPFGSPDILVFHPESPILEVWSILGKWLLKFAHPTDILQWVFAG